MKLKEIVISFILVCIVVSVRLYRIQAPLADWHSWRQSDTASVARNYIKFGFDILRPRYDDLSNIPSGKDNPSGWRMVEFPLYQFIGAGLARGYPQISIEVWLRLVSVFASAATTVFLVFLVSRRTNMLGGVLTGLVYALLPYSIFYGRTILPETFAVFWAVLSLFLLSRVKNGTKGNWLTVIFAAVSGAIALLIKPTAGFLLIPAPYVLLKGFGFSKNWIIGLFAYCIIGLAPLFWWRGWILQFPEGIPSYSWLLNSNNIRFKGAWFHWLFAERLGKLILGYWGLIPLAVGLLMKPTKDEGWFFRWLFAGSLLYLIVFATGNVQHDYYQIILLPVVSIFVGKGLSFLLTNTVFSKYVSYGLFTICCLFTFAFSWYTMRTFYWINRPEIVEAGRIADELIPKTAKVIAPYNGDTTFLHQTNRQGWPIGFDIEKKIKMGATHYITVSPSETDFEMKQLSNCFTVLIRNDRFAIIDLTKRTFECSITNP